jgi:hypothetical protein
MIKPFKLLNGYTYSNELHAPYIPLQITHAPPEGISHRHWNMLPQDLRGATLQEMDSFIQGWEDGRIVGVVNPYRDRTRRNLWNRGYLECNRRRRVYTERDVEYYNTDDFVFSDVSSIMFDPISSQPYKHMMFRHIEDGDTVEGNRIFPDHPMWNFPDII